MDADQEKQAVPYNKMVVQIEHEIQDLFDGYESTGFTAVPDSASFSFRANFNKSLLPMFLEMFEEIGFPDGTVGISEKATGFNEDEGYSFPVPDCYGLYFLLGEIPGDMMEKYNTLSNARHDAHFDRLFGKPVKPTLR